MVLNHWHVVDTPFLHFIVFLNHFLITRLQRLRGRTSYQRGTRVAYFTSLPPDGFILAQLHLDTSVIEDITFIAQITRCLQCQVSQWTKRHGSYGKRLLG